MASEAGCGGEGGILKTWMRECWWREEGMEAELLEEEEMMNVAWKSLEAMCLHSSMHGNKWPCPKAGTTQISSFDIFLNLSKALIFRSFEAL